MSVFLRIGLRLSSAVFGLFVLTIGGIFVLVPLLKSRSRSYSSFISLVSDFVRGFIVSVLFPISVKLLFRLVRWSNSRFIGSVSDFVRGFGHMHCLYEWSRWFWHAVLLHLSVIGFCVSGMLAAVRSSLKVSLFGVFAEKELFPFYLCLCYVSAAAIF